jgi:hypothetical protein
VEDDPKAIRIHIWLPQGLLWVGTLALGLKFALFLWIEISIGGGLAHMGIKGWALPAYGLAFLLMAGLTWRYRRMSLCATARENRRRTLVLCLAAFVALVAAARGLVLWTEESPYEHEVSAVETKPRSIRSI